jgi:hypothetical protein
MTAAVTSSASIAGWAIWQKASWLWAMIIAASQVLSAIRSYLPFARRAEVLKEATPSYNSLLARIECQWFHVSEGLLSEMEINDLISQFHKEQSDIDDRIFSKVTLTERADLKACAELHCNQYFAQNYEQTANPENSAGAGN